MAATIDVCATKRWPTLSTATPKPSMVRTPSSVGSLLRECHFVGGFEAFGRENCVSHFARHRLSGRGKERSLPSRRESGQLERIRREPRQLRARIDERLDRRRLASFVLRIPRDCVDSKKMLMEFSLHRRLVQARPIESGRADDSFEDAIAEHRPALAVRLFSRAGADRWGVTPEVFAQALARSAASAAGDRELGSREIARLLESLHLEISRSRSPAPRVTRPRGSISCASSGRCCIDPRFRGRAACRAAQADDRPPLPRIRRGEE